MAAPAIFTGTVSYDAASLAGTIVSDAHRLGGAFVVPTDGGQALNSFSLVADWVVMNSTYETRVGVGFVPTRPSAPLTTYPTDAGSREKVYGYATVEATTTGSEAGLLIVPQRQGSARLHAANTTQVTVKPASGEVWQVGYYANNVNASAPSQSNPLDRYFQPPAGDPAFTTLQRAAWQITGDLVLHVWGANLTVENATAHDTHRSGRWDENVTPARRDRHAQLIELRATNASFRLETLQGVARWTAPEAGSTTTGVVTFNQPRGRLEAAQTGFELGGKTARVEGHVAQKTAGDGSGSRMVSHVVATVYRADASGLLLAPAASPRPSAWSVWVAGALAAAALAVLAIKAVLDYFGWSRDWSGVMTRAQEALTDNRWRRCLRLSRALLKRRAPQAEFLAEAWFVHSASRMALGDYEWLLTELSPRMRRLGNPPALAYILAIVAFRVGHKAAAKKWQRVFRQDPHFMKTFLDDPALDDMRTQLGCSESPASAGYA